MVKNRSVERVLYYNDNYGNWSREVIRLKLKSNVPLHAMQIIVLWCGTLIHYIYSCDAVRMLIFFSLSIFFFHCPKHCENTDLILESLITQLFPRLEREHSKGKLAIPNCEWKLFYFSIYTENSIVHFHKNNKLVELPIRLRCREAKWSAGIEFPKYVWSSNCIYVAISITVYGHPCARF